MIELPEIMRQKDDQPFSEQELIQKQISIAFSQDQFHHLTLTIHMMLSIFGQKKQPVNDTL